MKFGIITPNWNRPKVLNLWCAGIQRLRNDLGIDFPAVVVSDICDINVCNAYNVRHITQENRPVNQKFNSGVYALKGLVEYVIVMGSDDVMSTPTLKSYLLAMEEGWDLIGTNVVYFYSTQGRYRGSLAKLQAKRILGVGKCISARVLDNVDWKPWNVNKNFGMDSIAQRAIEPFVKSMKLIEDAVIVDIKSKQNMNRFDFWGKKLGTIDPQEFLSILSPKELDLLKTI